MTAPNSPLLIRKATQNDLDIIRDIAYKTWPSTYSFILTPSQLEYMLGFFYSIDALTGQMNNGQQFFIAEYNGTAVGFGAVSQVDETTFKLNKLYVRPDIQKTGAGKALMDHAIDIARNNNAKQMILNVNRFNAAKTFYEKMGFIVLKEEDVDLGNGVVQEDYVMGLQLNS